MARVSVAGRVSQCLLLIYKKINKSPLCSRAIARFGQRRVRLWTVDCGVYFRESEVLTGTQQIIINLSKHWFWFTAPFLEAEILDWSLSWHLFPKQRLGYLFWSYGSPCVLKAQSRARRETVWDFHMRKQHLWSGWQSHHTGVFHKATLHPHRHTHTLLQTPFLKWPGACAWRRRRRFKNKSAQGRSDILKFCFYLRLIERLKIQHPDKSLPTRGNR